MELVLDDKLVTAVAERYGERTVVKLRTLPNRLPWSREVTATVTVVGRWPDQEQLVDLTHYGKCWPEQLLVWLNLKQNTGKDLLAAAVHELRHLWQYHCHREFLTRRAVTKDPVVAYWMKPCEVDARRAEWCYRYRLPQPKTINSDWPIGRTEFELRELTDPLTDWWIKQQLFG